MADRQSINPRISTGTRHLLQQACQERGCSQGDLVEAALVAFLTPTEGGTSQELVLQKLVEMDKVLAGMTGLLQAVVEHLAEHGPAPAPPVATYEQMYGPIVATPDVGEPAEPQPSAAPRSGWRWWFLREDPA
jgi:hypothetical protein